MDLFHRFILVLCLISIAISCLVLFSGMALGESHEVNREESREESRKESREDNRKESSKESREENREESPKESREETREENREDSPKESWEENLEETSDDSLERETVVTAPAASKVEVKSAAREKVSAKTMQERGASNVAEALETVPGVQAESNPRGERLLYLRGFEQRQIPVYLDGMPLEIPFDGRLDLSKVPLGLLGRLDVRKAPGPLEWGGTGMGGAIHLKTRSPFRPPSIDIGLRGTAGIMEGRAAAQYSHGRVGMVLASGFHQQTYFNLPQSYEPKRNEDGGKRNNSGKTGVSVGFRTGVRLSASHSLSLVGIGSYGSYDVPPSDKSFLPFYWRFPEYGFLFLGLTHRGRWGPGRRSRETIYFGGFRNVLVGYDDNTYTSRETMRGFRSVYEDSIIGAKTSHFFDLPTPKWFRNLSLMAWADYRRYFHKQTWEAETDDFSKSVATNRVDLSIQLKGLVSGSHALSLQLQNLVEIAEKPEGGGASLYWGFGPLVCHEWTHSHGSLRTTLARRTRIPSMKERYSEAFGLQAPNPDLKPESAWQAVFDTVIRFQNWLHLSGAVFGYLVDDIIDKRLTNDGLLQQRNVGRALLAGGEVGFRMRFDFGMKARLGYSYLFARRLSSTSGETAGDELEESDKLSGRTPHAVFLSLRYSPISRLKVFSFFRLAGPTPITDPDTAAQVTLGTRLYWNARVSFGPFDGLSAFVSATNILDAENETLPGFPEQGRTFWAGVGYTN